MFHPVVTIKPKLKGKGFAWIYCSFIFYKPVFPNLFSREEPLK